jgi:prepilin-type N-terminal cleavage/methylation domain-containing protein
MKSLKKGFTLIELIVVIAILAILALMIVPQISGYVDKANTSVAQNNLNSCVESYNVAYTSVKSGVDAAAKPNDGCTFDPAWAQDAPADPKGITKVTYAKGSKSYVGTVANGVVTYPAN